MVINVPELPVSGAVDLLAGVTVEPAIYNGQEIMVIVAEVAAVDAAGNEHEADWDGWSVLNIEPGLTYTITYMACIADDSASTFGLEGAAGVLPLAELAKTIQGQADGPAAKIGDEEYDTLQKAVEAAGKDDIIVLQHDVKENIVTNGKSFILDMGGHTLTGLGNDSVVTVNNSSSVSLKNGTITGGTGNHEGNGGGVYVQSGYVSIAEDCVIADNRAASRGGGLFVNAGAHASLDDGTITNNESGANGGGVYVGTWSGTATFTLNSGTISGNTASSNGGGIYTRSGKITVFGGTIDNNIATNGGGVYVGEGNAEFAMTDGYIGTVSDDTDKATGNTAILGGGIYVGDKAGTVNISGGHINGNNAENGGGMYFIRATSYPEMHVVFNGGEVKGNIATKNGGGIYALSQNWGVIDIVLDEETAITENTAAVNGGGVYVNVDGSGRSRKLDIKNASITKNNSYDGAGVYSQNYAITVSTGANISDNIASHSGGGIYVANRTLQTKILDDLTISGGTISGNKANAEPTEVPVIAGTNTPLDNTTYRGSRNEGGGGIFAGCHVILEGGKISDNYAKSGGGGIYMALADLKADVQLHMTGGVVSNNRAELNEAGGIYVGSGKGNLISGGTISDNRTDTKFDWGGGGIFVHHDAELQILNAWVNDNTAAGFGGGVAGCPSGTVKVFAVEGASIYGNHAKGGLTDRPEGVGKRHDQIAHENPVFMHANRFQDYYCALNSYVSGVMLGDADANWVGSYGNDADEIMAVRINTGSGVSASYLMGLTAEPEESAHNKENSIDYGAAAAGAAVKIINNYSGTHGGGIMSNGALMMGIGDESEDSNTQLTISADKTYEQKTEDGQIEKMSLADVQFGFRLLDKQPVIDPETGLWTMAEGTVVVSEETNNSVGKVNFTIEKAKLDKLVQENGNSFLLYMVEKPGASDDIAYDNQVYQIEVSVKLENGQYVVATDEVSVWTKDSDWKAVNAISFSNTYTKPIGSLQIAKQVVSGDEPGKLPAGLEAKSFAFSVVRLQAEGTEPMRDNAGKEVYNNTVVINYPEATSSEVLKLTPGRYMITENDSSIGDLIWSWQAAGATAVTAEDGSLLGYVVEVKKHATATVTVTNSYTEKKKEPKPEYINLTVKKEWQHGNNPADKQPAKV
ncbi:MAG: right-handed parallel beta-helix repeat-containing protein, partial [Clostridium sp.]|nr:right-handed parallel beta-helix repeat-containing protein [Clostridium sp.]